MKNQIVTLPFPAAGALHQCKPSPFLHLAALRAFRRLRISLPRRAPHPLCGELRAIRTARESAEIAVWQANGGNTLRRFRLRLR